MHNRIGTTIIVWILALSVSACGAFEIGIEQVQPSGGTSQVDWQATAETLQVEATHMSGSTLILAGTPALTLTPDVEVAVRDQAIVAFVQGGDIWVMPLRDGKAQRLTHDGRNQAPSWSASGEWISFVKNPAFPELWVMRHDGSEAQRLDSLSELSTYAWSPTVDMLALGKGGGVRFFAFVPGKPLSLILESDIAALESNPYIGELAWSPSGQQVALTLWTQTADPTAKSVKKDGLWVVDAASGTPTQLLASEVPEKGPFILHSWGSDGEYLLYWQAPILSASILADGVPFYRVPAQGGTPQVLAESVVYHDDAVQSQPNGLSQIAIVEGSGREMWHHKSLHSVLVSGMQEWEMTPPDQAVSSPIWSPAGDVIAYIGMPDVESVVGGPEAQAALNLRRLWIAEPNNANPYAVSATNSEREEAPQWIDDHSLLIARIDMDGKVSLWVVSKTGELEQQVVDEITPAPEWFGYYGHIDWQPYFSLWRPHTAGQSVIASEMTPTPVPFAPLSQTPVASGGRTLATFLEGLHSTLTSDGAVALWGEPDEVTGSGLVIYRYVLDDGLWLWLGFPGAGPISYAHLETPSGRKFAITPMDDVVEPVATEGAVTSTPTPASMDAVKATPVSTPTPAEGSPNLDR